MFALENQPHGVVKGIITNLNPIITRIDKASIVELLTAFDTRKNNDSKKKNFIWAYVSLLKIAREKSLIKYQGNDFYLESIKISKERINVLFFKKIKCYGLKI